MNWGELFTCRLLSSGKAFEEDEVAAEKGQDQPVLLLYTNVNSLRREQMILLQGLTAAGALTKAISNGTKSD